MDIKKLKELAESIEIVKAKIEDAETEIGLLKNIKLMLEIEVEDSFYTISDEELLKQPVI